MRHVITAIVLVASLAVVAAGCGGGDESSETSATVEWANEFCTAITTWGDSLKQIGTDLTDPSSLDQEGLDQAAGDIKVANEALVDDLRSLGTPDTESGQEVKDALDEFATTLESDLADIEDTVEGISGLGDVLGAVTSISTSLSSMSTAFSSTLGTIEDADVQSELQDAFEQADSCGEISGSSG